MIRITELVDRVSNRRRCCVVLQAREVDRARTESAFVERGWKALPDPDGERIGLWRDIRLRWGDSGRREAMGLVNDILRAENCTASVVGIVTPIRESAPDGRRGVMSFEDVHGRMPPAVQPIASSGSSLLKGSFVLGMGAYLSMCALAVLLGIYRGEIVLRLVGEQPTVTLFGYLVAAGPLIVVLLLDKAFAVMRVKRLKPTVERLSGPFSRRFAIIALWFAAAWFIYVMVAVISAMAIDIPSTRDLGIGVIVIAGVLALLGVVVQRLTTDGHRVGRKILSVVRTALFGAVGAFVFFLPSTVVFLSVGRSDPGWSYGWDRALLLWLGLPGDFWWAVTFAVMFLIALYLIWPMVPRALRGLPASGALMLALAIPMSAISYSSFAALSALDGDGPWDFIVSSGCMRIDEMWHPVWAVGASGSESVRPRDAEHPASSGQVWTRAIGPVAMVDTASTCREMPWGRAVG